MEIRTLRHDDLERAWELDRDAFHAPDEYEARFLQWDPECLLGAFDGERLVAVAGGLSFGQFFGGRAVPMGGLSSVSVAPDRRGEGLARRVILACLGAMRERGEVVSSLLPATTRLYRGLGWEVAGGVRVASIAPHLLQSLPPAVGVRTRPAEDADSAAIRDCYASVARSSNGFLSRPAGWWKLKLQVWKKSSVFVVEGDDGVCGYLAYRQLDGPDGALGGRFRLQVHEAVWSTRDAGLALWRLLGSWSAQVESISYRSGPEDPLLLLLPEQEGELLAEVRWMSRLIEPAGAVAARGFPDALELETGFELHDTELPENDGVWRLRVAKGQGALERGGAGGPRLDVGALSSLYTGWANTALLERAGRLEGGTAEQRAALDAAFAGPTPGLLDEF